MTLGELILAYRNKHNISQRNFADLCNLSNGYISLLEKGGVNPNTNESITPTIPSLRKIAKGMGLSIEELSSIIDETVVDLSDFNFSGAEIDLIEAYRKATPDDRQIVDLTLKKYISQTCTTEVSPKAI